MTKAMRQMPERSGRAQHGASGAAAKALSAELESVLRTGANAGSLARVGRVAAPPAEGAATEALEAGRDDLPRTAFTGSDARRCKAGVGQWPTLVAQQCQAAQRRADHCLVRPTGLAPTRLTSSSRTARCGSARRVVWQGRSPYGLPPMPIRQNSSIHMRKKK